jgi:hypothetical protein
LLGGVMTLRYPAIEVGQGFSHLSDLHLGSAHTDEALILAELEQANKHRDRIALNGDIFDLILPNDLKRSRPCVLHQRFQGNDNVIGSVINWAVDFFEPFAERIDWIGLGNHEDAVLKHHHLDPVQDLVDKLNLRLEARSRSRKGRSKLPHRIKYGGYCGFAIYPLQSTQENFTLFYHHGFGGGSSLSGAASDLNKMLAQLEGVDLVWLGHKHQKLSGHIVRISPALRGDQPLARDVRYLRTGAYLDSTRGQSQESVKERGRQSIYSVDKGYPFAGLGGARVVVESLHPLQLRVIQ